MINWDKVLNTADNKNTKEAKEIWNAAIDKCIEVASKYDNPISREDNMRTLKK